MTAPSTDATEFVARRLRDFPGVRATPERLFQLGTCSQIIFEEMTSTCEVDHTSLLQMIWRETMLYIDLHAQP